MSNKKAPHLVFPATEPEAEVVRKKKRRRRQPWYLSKRVEAIRMLPPPPPHPDGPAPLLVDMKLLDLLPEQNAKLDLGKDNGRFTLGPPQRMGYGSKRGKKKKKKK